LCLGDHSTEAWHALFHFNTHKSWAPVAHICNSTYLRSWNWEDHGSMLALANSSGDPHLQNNHRKVDCMCGSCGRAPALQAWNSEFKSQSPPQKKNRNIREYIGHFLFGDSPRIPIIKNHYHFDELFFPHDPVSWGPFKRSSTLCSQCQDVTHKAKQVSFPKIWILGRGTVRQKMASNIPPLELHLNQTPPGRPLGASFFPSPMLSSNLWVPDILPKQNCSCLS
jgi:hypothetical protein